MGLLGLTVGLLLLLMVVGLWGRWLGLEQVVVGGLRLRAARLIGRLGQGLEGGEGRAGLWWLQGLKGGEQGLGSKRLLRGVDDVDLVWVILGRGLWGHVVNLVYLVVHLLHGVGSLRGGFSGLGVMGGLLDLRRRGLCLVMAFETPAALMRVAVSAHLDG